MSGRVQVKICGLTTPQAVAAAAAADWIGFVFYPPSPRFVTPAQAARLAAPAKPAKVGLFVDPRDDQVAEALAAVDLQILQLVGTDDRAAQLKRRFGLPVWRAIGVAASMDLPDDLGAADAFLLDAKPPPGSDRPGGNAQAFDWSILHDWAAPGPWLLAGGLTPDTVGGAIAATGARAVDVSSGVERSPGEKDPSRIEQFLQAVRQAG